MRRPARTAAVTARRLDGNGRTSRPRERPAPIPGPTITSTDRTAAAGSWTALLRPAPRDGGGDPPLGALPDAVQHPPGHHQRHRLPDPGGEAQPELRCDLGAGAG